MATGPTGRDLSLVLPPIVRYNPCRQRKFSFSKGGNFYEVNCQEREYTINIIRALMRKIQSFGCPNISKHIMIYEYLLNLVEN